MKIGGYDYVADMNNGIQNNLMDFSTNVKVNENVTPVSPDAVRPVSQPASEPERQADLSISDNGNAMLRARRSLAMPQAGTFAPTAFSTDKSGEASADADTSVSLQSGNDVLERYRYFVPTTRYEGTEGVVRRIFG